MSTNLLLKTGAALTSGVVLYAVAGYIGVPLAVQWALSTYVPAALNARTMTAQNIRFNPWTWTLQLDGVRVASKNNTAADILSLKHAQIDISAASLVQGAPVLDSLLVDTLRLRLTMNESNTKEVSQAGAATQSPSSRIPAMSLANVRLINSSVHLTNPRAQASVDITDIAFELPLFSTMEAGKLPAGAPKLAFKLDGKRVQASALTTPDSVGLSLKLRELNVAKLIRASGAELPVQIHRAQLGADLQLHYSQVQNKARIVLSGTIDAERLHMDLPDAAGTVRAQQAHLQILSFEPMQQRLALGAVTLSEPDITFVRLPAPAKAQPAAPSPAAKSDWSWSVRSLALNKGKFTLLDRTLSPAGRLALTQISASVGALSSQKAAPSAYRAALHAGSSATVQASGTLSINPPALTSDVRIASLALADFNPWVQPLAGAQLSSGTLGLDTQVTLQGGQKTRVQAKANLLVDALNARHTASGKTLMSWKQAKVDSLSLRSVDPVDLTIARLTVHEPAQKAVQKADKVLGFLSAIAAAKGKDKTAKKIAQWDQSLQKDIVLTDVIYRNNRFAVNGRDTNTVQTLIVDSLNAVFAKMTR